MSYSNHPKLRRLTQVPELSVNLGGWLVLEPFISPALYEPFYPNAVDEWTLSTLIKARDGNLSAIEDHYNTFIVGFYSINALYVLSI